MKKNHQHIILYATLIFLALQVNGQDIHFSQFDWNSVFFNPAIVGQYPQNEYGIIYRDQGFKVTDHAYKSMALFTDTYLDRHIGENDHFGLGFSLINDKAGTGNIKTTEGQLNLSYHLDIPSKRPQRVSISPQLVYIERGLQDIDAFTFEEELLGGNFTEDYLNSNSQYLDLNLGFAYSIQLNNQIEWLLGSTFNHFNNRQEQFSNLNIDKFGFRQNYHTKFQIKIQQSLTLQSKVQFQILEQSKEFVIQQMAKINFPGHRAASASFGLGYRSADALQLLVAIRYGNFEFGFAYDTNTSSLSRVSAPVAGLELGIKYIMPFKRKLEKILIFPIAQIPPKNIYYNSQRKFVPKYIEWQINDKLETEEILVQRNIEIAPIIPDKNKQRTGGLEKTYTYHNIYYNFDDDKILQDSEVDLNKILIIIMEFPNQNVQIFSHTDSRGNDTYNIDLSKRRAKSVVKWLIDHGVEATRLESFGLGETVLTNKCGNGVPCSEAAHRSNRRTEFKFIKQNQN